jgi:hypothetical protein
VRSTPPYIFLQLVYFVVVTGSSVDKILKTKELSGKILNLKDLSGKIFSLRCHFGCGTQNTAILRFAQNDGFGLSARRGLVLRWQRAGSSVATGLGLRVQEAWACRMLIGRVIFV